VQLLNWISLGSVVLLAVFLPSFLLAADWQNGMGANSGCSKEKGTLVVGIPASSELAEGNRDKIQRQVWNDVELFPSRGPENVTRI